MPFLNGKKLLYHVDGIRGKVSEVRELVETLDQMFDSFHKVNRISKDMLGMYRYQQGKIKRLR
ncbi:hypothetical protein LOK74_11500 [Brevibacillus humidisoli]|uniref:hypothetical protein n=1 Tax=Brevibacillus humidisoli TaxID=2895522 RepID=UPI001E3FAFB9|nr:hypothetical protein [Brevibacillus humidisoli]UFJ43064.1 hypothetical protein LOK74_11500 [Brevibacillus humidisoli]